MCKNDVVNYRPPDKRMHVKIIFLISQPKQCCGY